MRDVGRVVFHHDEFPIPAQEAIFVVSAEEEIAFGVSVDGLHCRDWLRKGMADCD